MYWSTTGITLKNENKGITQSQQCPAFLAPVWMQKHLNFLSVKAEIKSTHQVILNEN